MSINKDSQKAPILRFKGFTDDWEQRKLGDLGEVSMNKRIYKDQTTIEGEVPFVKIGTFGKKPDSFISRELFEEYKLKYPYPNIGDILISAAGSIGRTLEYNGEDVYFQDSNIVWLNHKGRLDNNFLKYFYMIVKWSGLEGSTIKRLYNKNILSTQINLPNIIEQEKIGTFLNCIENTIRLHQHKLDQLNQLKEALLQQMFPGKGETVPKLRFAGFEGDWEERKLGNLLHERNQKSVQTEEYPLVSFTVENGVTEKTERYNRNQLVSGDSDAKVYKVTKLNDIVYNPANLKFGAIDRNKYGKAVFSPIYVTFEVIEDYIFAEFIEFIVTSQTFIGRALKYQQGTVYERQSVGVDDFLNLTIRIPNLDEQKLIGLFLNDLNKELLLQKDKLDQLKNMKQVLLENMFI